jgi:nucleotide-binding universal stress UspA family protein
MFPPKKILFPVDFSERCLDAARMVETFTGHFQSELTLLHVVEPPNYNDLPVDTASIAERKLSGYLATEMKHFEVRRELRSGDPAREIVAFAHAGGYDLIMAPTHGYGGFRRFLLGSVTAKILHDALCPVWTGVHMERVQPLENISFHRVACAIDLGKQSCRALRWAAQFAREFDAQLSILHALPPVGEAELGVDCGPRVQQIESAREQIEAVQESAGADADILILPGEVPRAVRAGVEQVAADLLIIGRSMEEGMLGRLRTNAYAIIRQSPCPVVSV